MTTTVPLPALTPIGPGPAYEDAAIWLPQLYAETARGGGREIQGRTFLRCRFEGPAVILPLSGCDFDGCNMGDSGGDVRNLLLRPAGDQKVVGALAFRDCVFRDCLFVAVGFTGPQTFIDQFIAMVGGATT